jgi:hypothetical protein
VVGMTDRVSWDAILALIPGAPSIARAGVENTSQASFRLLPLLLEELHKNSLAAFPLPPERVPAR